jgi:hypothetical protein
MEGKIKFIYNYVNNASRSWFYTRRTLFLFFYRLEQKKLICCPRMYKVHCERQQLTGGTLLSYLNKDCSLLRAVAAVHAMCNARKVRRWACLTT